MNSAGTRSRQANTKFSRVLGIGARHESGRFFVPHVDEPDFVLPLSERLHQAVYSVARNPENVFNAPIDEAVHDDIRSVFRHGALPGESELPITCCKFIVAPARDFVHQPKAVCPHENRRRCIRIALSNAKIHVVVSARPYVPACALKKRDAMVCSVRNEAPTAIQDYALIGDCKTAALVSRRGSIDWLCLPRFDSPACFAALLGSPENGRWLLQPLGKARSTRRYRPHTLVLETKFEDSDGQVTLIDFMPMNAAGPRIVRIVRGDRGVVAMRMDLVIRFDYGMTVPWVTRQSDGSLL